MNPAGSHVEAWSARNQARPLAWLAVAVHLFAWSLASALVSQYCSRGMGVAIGLLGLTCLLASAAIDRHAERLRRVRPVPRMADVDSPFATTGDIEAIEPLAPMLWSGAFEGPDGYDRGIAGAEVAEMVSRLDLKTLRWIESSQAEQAFLGWNLAQLKEMSFFDIIDTEDRELARTQLASAIVKGEGHNLLYRIRTARDEVKAIELHLAVRYRRDESSGHPRPTYLKLRIADMTKKVRADRELRRRTKELTDANSRLRRINRELEDLKNRYGDLYQNAPALYFSIDAKGTIVECNDTLLGTLGRHRDQVVGQPYTSLLIEASKPIFDEWFDILKKTGYVELESRWAKHDGEVIDVWLSSTAVRSSDGSFLYSRSVGRDVTARRALEAELQDKNERLARANAELIRKNKELDQFAYIVAHDLREPLRTLIAFSDFLEKDCGDRIGEAGRDNLRHIVEAARRMRSLISDLETLGRAGRVAGDFGRVQLESVIDRVRADYAELLRCRRAEIRVVGDLPDLWGDGTRIGQLIANLVVNGLKYNRDSLPRVEIEAVKPSDVEPQTGFATLAVRDNGIGIDPKFHHKIFELFRRLHTRDEYEGTGAGLAICQKIVEAHGGRIRVESEPGRGSSFLMTLPLAPEPIYTAGQVTHVV